MRSLVLGAGAAVLLSACGSATTKAAVPAAPVVTAAAACPENEAPAVDAWPEAVPATFPTFPGQRVTSSTTTGTRTTIQFTTPQSLRESVGSILKIVPAAGYVLGRGEAERVEAEAPFSDKGYNGALRVTEVDSCMSRWLLVLEPRSLLLQSPATPLVMLSSYPSVSPSAFGG